MDGTNNQETDESIRFPIIPKPDITEKFYTKEPFGGFIKHNFEENPFLELKPDLGMRLPPSFRPLPEIDSFRDESMTDVFAKLQSLLGELRGRRDGYQIYPDPAERAELVQIFDKTTDYLHSNGIKNFVLMDRSARPAYIGIRETWQKKYPNEPMPDIYFLNPTGFMNAEDAASPGQTGMSKGSEVMFDGFRKDLTLGDPYTEIRSQEEIERDFTESYKRLTANRNQPTLLFDTCIHSGDSIRPVQTTLQNVGFTDLKIGVVGNDRNFSGINPDFVAVEGTPIGICYSFDKDRIIERRFDSVTSRASEDTAKREKGIELRKEIKAIVNGTVPEKAAEKIEPALEEDEEAGFDTGVKEITRNDRLQIMQRIAPQFGVSIDILATEGQQYTHQSDLFRRTSPYKGIVNKGQSYIRASSQTGDLGGFFRAVQDQEEKVKDLSSSHFYGF